MVTMAELSIVRRRSWCLSKEHEKLYKINYMFVDNEQNLKEISSFVSLDL